MTHDDVNTILQNGLAEKIARAIAYTIYPRIRGYIPEEAIKTVYLWQVTLRERSKTAFGDKETRFQPDALLFVYPSRAANSKNLVFTVLLEVKTTRDDLFADKKLERHYLGYTDLVFLIVPTDLVECAMQKVSGNPYIGIIDVHGCIRKFPQKQTVTYKNMLDISYEAIRRLYTLK